MIGLNLGSFTWVSSELGGSLIGRLSPQPHLLLPFLLKLVTVAKFYHEIAIPHNWYLPLSLYKYFPAKLVYVLLAGTNIRSGICGPRKTLLPYYVSV